MRPGTSLKAGAISLNPAFRSSGLIPLGNGNRVMVTIFVLMMRFYSESFLNAFIAPPLETGLCFTMHTLYD